MDQITNQPLSTLWTRCRVIGVINMIYFGVHIIITLLKVALFIFFLFETKTKAQEEEFSKINMVLLIIASIIVLIIMIVFFRINYEITSGNPPSNGTKTERWLIFHKVLFCLYAICSIYMAIYRIEFLIGGIILLTILAIEIFVVNSFNKKITSAGGIAGIVL